MTCWSLFRRVIILYATGSKQGIDIVFVCSLVDISTGCSYWTNGFIPWQNDHGAHLGHIRGSGRGIMISE